MPDFEATATTYAPSAHPYFVAVHPITRDGEPIVAAYFHSLGSCTQQLLTSAEARAFAEVLTKAADAAEPRIIEHDPAETVPWTADDEADERKAAAAMEDGPLGDRDRYHRPGSAW